MATTQRCAWSRPLFVCVLVLLVAGIAVALLFPYLLEQKIHQKLAENPRFEGTVESVDYSLLSNRLALSGLTLKKRTGLPMDVACAQFTLEGIDRASLLAILLDKTLTDVPPVLQLGDMGVQDLRIGIDNEITITLEQRRVINTSVDVERLKVLLDKQRDKDPNASSTSTPTNSLYEDAVTCLSYDSGYGKNIQVVVGTPADLAVTVKEFTESQVDHGNFARSELRGLSVTGSLAGLQESSKNNTTQELGSIERIVAEDFFCSPELLGVDPDTMETHEVLEYLKQMFLGEKPLIKKIVIDNLRSDVTDATRIALQNLTWENTSTSPFTCSLSVTGLSVPATSSFSMLGYKRLDYSAKLALKIPTKAAGPISCDAFLDGKDTGVLTLQSNGDIRDPKALCNGDLDTATIARIALEIKDAGLLERLGRLASLFTGQQSLSTALDASMSTMPERYRTPVNLKNLEAAKTFLEQSGSIKIVFAPEKPLSVKQLEDDTVFFNALTVTAVPANPATAAPDATK